MLTDRDHNDVLTLCECIVEAWARGRYEEAEQWLDTALAIIGSDDFVDEVDNGGARREGQQ